MTDLPPLDRVLIVAPHPDDEVIGTGGLVQRAIAAGGAVHVAILTGGGNNPWPQRAIYRKWRVTTADQREWIGRRIHESTRGLSRLGAPAGCVSFLDFPDQGLSRLARANDDRVTRAIASAVAGFRPTLVIAPSRFDLHGDHRAASWFTHEAVAKRVPIATYVVHGRAPAPRTLFVIRLEAHEQAAKRGAIESHASQLLLSRQRFLSHARATETYYEPEYDISGLDSRLTETIANLRQMAQAVAGVRQG